MATVTITVIERQPSEGSPFDPCAEGGVKLVLA